MRLSEAYPGSELYDLLVDVPSSAGPVVNERTAMCVSAVYACVSLIAGAIASLPLHFYRRRPDGSRERIDHDYWWLFNEQSSEAWTSAAAKEYLVSSMLLRGDGIAWLQYNNANNRVIRVVPLDRNYVVIVRDGQRRKYDVIMDDGQIKGLEQEEILHWPNFGFNGLYGMSQIRYAARQGVGIALAADEYSARFFSNGARPDFALIAPGVLKPEQIDELRRTWAQRYGGLSKSHLPAVLHGGLTIKELTMNAEDAQLIATRQFQVVDICRAFGVPPHMVGATEKTTSWGTGLEEMSRGFVRYTLRPHLNRITEELNRKLFPRSNVFCEFNVDALLEGDSRAQAELFSKALGGPGAQGWMSVNEVRRLKNLPPLEGYDDIPRAGARQEGERNAPSAPDQAVPG